KKALAKRPDDRYQSAEEFADALRTAAQRESTAPALGPAAQASRGSTAASADPTVIGSSDPTVIRAPEPKSPAQATAPAAANAASMQQAIAPAVQQTLAAPTSAPAKKSQLIPIAIIVAVVVIVVASRPGTWLKPPPAESAKAPDATKVAQAQPG